MKNLKKILSLFLLIGFLASCQMQQGNFLKQKYLNLKKMDSKGEVVTTVEQSPEIEKVEAPIEIEEAEIPEVSFENVEIGIEELPPIETKTDGVESTDEPEIKAYLEEFKANIPKKLIEKEGEDEPKNSNIRKIHNALFWISVTLLIACLVFLIWTSITGGIGVLILMFLCLFGWVFFVIIQFFVSFKVPKDQRGPFFKVQQIYAYIVVALAVIPILGMIVLLIMDIFNW